MKSKFQLACLAALITCTLIACKEGEKTQALSGPELQHTCMAALTDVVVHDIFSPPVASRIYAYANLAFHEALLDESKKTLTITGRMKGFKTTLTPEPAKETSHRLSAAWAFLKVSRSLVFSKDSLTELQQTIQETFSGLPKDIYTRSVAYGDSIASMVLSRAASDRYKETRGMPRYSAFRHQPGLWQQTPPDYSDAAEPHWALILPLLLDSAAACKPPAPIPFRLDENSAYGKELNEVYQISKRITPSMDTIAHFWDDNPFVTEHTGHLTYANKKLTPVGHWMVITSILCRQASLDERATAQAYALTASAIFDGFISCWDEKYRSRTVRPITVIRERFEPEWNSLLQTPPFPEYTSGHSVISAAGSMVLRKIFGDGFAFRDSSELPYLGLERSFPSIEAAADEAGISRLYGGIHYRSAIDRGKEQGFNVARQYLELVR